MGRSPIEDSCWSGVSDPQQRKRIQDRLAQRARRRRLAEARIPTSVNLASPCGTQSNVDGDNSRQAISRSSTRKPSSQSSARLAPQTCVVRSTSAQIPRPIQQYVQAPVSSTSDPAITVLGTLPLSVAAALFQNGMILNLPCATTFPSKSAPTLGSADIPDSLQPTALQLTTIHPIFIDRFPFPKMRDNFISLQSIIDEEDFLKDLFCLASFSLKPGTASWDPTGWKMGKEFGEKWGFLFY